ncbi:MAG: formate-dependent phosphoribosylglycinamide formyltransferase [Candidatus Methanofastidiosia archaeon]|jgi:phosphoribosylglycinamide formyltransferase 2
MLLGSGELGKEVIIEAQRLGLETVAVDRYQGAPAQHAADTAYTGDMTQEGFLQHLVKRENPDFIVPEIEAINLDALTEFEDDGIFVSPRAEAQKIAMDRFRLRETLDKAGVQVSNYHFTSTFEDFESACKDFNYNCITKARFSSSGHGSYIVESKNHVKKAWDERKKARKPSEDVIVEEFIDFSTEDNQLVVRNKGTYFCKTLGHYQLYGDYHSSWQPIYRNEEEKIGFESVKDQVYQYAEKATLALAGKKGRGIHAVEQFLDFENKKVYVNEVSCRPHDTGMVTFKTHYPGYSQSGLHVRAVAEIPVEPHMYTEYNGEKVLTSIKPGASHVIVSPAEGWNPQFKGIDKALQYGDVWVFKKPYAFHEPHHGRRLGVALALADTVADAIKHAELCAHHIEIKTNESKSWKPQWMKEKHVVS